MSWDLGDAQELSDMRSALQVIEASLKMLVEQNRYAYVNTRTEFGSKMLRIDRVTSAVATLMVRSKNPDASDEEWLYYWQECEMA